MEKTFQSFSDDLIGAVIAENDEFKSAIMSFLNGVSTLDPESILGKAFGSRVRDKFRSVGAPAI